MCYKISEGRFIYLEILKTVRRLDMARNDQVDLYGHTVNAKKVDLGCKMKFAKIP